MQIFEVIDSMSCGGAERFVVDLSNELARQGHDVTIVTLMETSNNPATSYNFKFVNNNVRIKELDLRHTTRCGWYALGKIIRQQRPDIVHSHLGGIAACYPAAYFRSARIRYFYTVHNIAEKTISAVWQKKLNHFYFRTDRIIPVTISDFCNKSYETFYQLPPAECIYNGREDIKTTNRLQEVKNEIEHLKLHPDDRVFVQAATICRRKNQLLSAEVFRRLQADGYHAILLLLGKASEDEYLRELRDQLPDNVFYLGEKDNVPDYLKCADGFILSSLYEGNPISLLEAFACGCVPVCTAVGGIVDVITEGETGYLASEVSEESLYNALKRYLDDPEKIATETLRAYYLQNHTMQICAGKYLDLFQSSIANNP